MYIFRHKGIIKIASILLSADKRKRKDEPYLINLLFIQEKTNVQDLAFSISSFTILSISFNLFFRIFPLKGLSCSP